MKEKEIADRRNFLKGSVAGAAGLVVASTTSVALGGEPGKKPKSALATEINVTNKVDVLVVGGAAAALAAKNGTTPLESAAERDPQAFA